MLSFRERVNTKAEARRAPCVTTLSVRSRWQTVSPTRWGVCLTCLRGRLLLYTCMWRPARRIRCLPQSLSAFSVLLGRVFLELTDLARLAGQPREVVLCVSGTQAARVTGARCSLGGFSRGFWRVEVRTSCLREKHTMG